MEQQPAVTLMHESLPFAVYSEFVYSCLQTNKQQRGRIMGESAAQTNRGGRIVMVATSRLVDAFLFSFRGKFFVWSLNSANLLKMEQKVVFFLNRVLKCCFSVRKKR